MKKSLLSTVLAAGLLIGFSGCSLKQAVPVQVQTGMQKSLNTKYIFNDSLSDKSVTKEELTMTLLREAENAGTVFPVTSRRLSGFDYHSGRSFQVNNDTLNIYYVNGFVVNSWDLYNVNLTDCTRSIDAVKIPLTIKGEKDFTLSTIYPTTFTSINCSAGMNSLSPLYPADRVGRDSLSVFETLSTTVINRVYVLEGEIDTQFPDKSVYANFKRKLGNYNWGYSNEHVSDIKKENTFALKIKGRQYPLYIEVYPYRSGSKVKYSTTLGYTLDSQGGSTLTKSELEVLRKEIAGIIND